MAGKLTLYKFRLLSDEQQYLMVFTKGSFLTSDLKGNHRFALYALEQFFVEIEYDNTSNEIVNKRAFVTGDLLNKYSDYTPIF